MVIEVNFNGAIHEFPDNTPDEVIKSAMDKVAAQTGPQSAPQTQPQTQPQQPQQELGTLGQLADVGDSGLEGFNKGLANTAGLPVDLYNLTNFGLRAGLDKFIQSITMRPRSTSRDGYSPVETGSSQWFNDRFKDAGITGYQPKTTAGRYADRVGEAAGGVVVPSLLTGGVAGVAQGSTQAGMRAAANTMRGSVVPSFGSGMAAQGAKEAGAGPGVETAAGLLGALVPGGALNHSSRVASPRAGAALADAEEAGITALNPTDILGRDKKLLAGTLDRFSMASKDGDISQKAIDQFDNYKKSLGSSIGVAADKTEIGQRMKDAGARWLDRFRIDTDRNFKDIEKVIAPTDKFIADNIIDALGGRMNVKGKLVFSPYTDDGLTRTNSAFVKEIQEDIARNYKGGNLTWAQLEGIRRKIGNHLTDGRLISDAPTGELKQLYAKISQDMRDAAKLKGPQAEAAFAKASNDYKAGQDYIDQVVTKLAGKNVDPEKVYAWATGNIKNGGTRINESVKHLLPEEKGALAATMIDRMGVEANGNFSISKFLRDANSISPGARKALFEGTKYADAMPHLERLERIAARMDKGSQPAVRVLSGGQNMLAQIGRLAPASLAGAGLAGPIGTVGGPIVQAIGQAGVKRLMTNPGFLRWLDSTPGTAGGKFNTRLLTGIAASYPEIRDEVDRLVAFLGED